MDLTHVKGSVVGGQQYPRPGHRASVQSLTNLKKKIPEECNKGKFR